MQVQGSSGCRIDKYSQVNHLRGQSRLPPPALTNFELLGQVLQGRGMGSGQVGRWKRPSGTPRHQHSTPRRSQTQPANAHHLGHKVVRHDEALGALWHRCRVLAAMHDVHLVVGEAQPPVQRIRPRLCARAGRRAAGRRSGRHTPQAARVLPKTKSRSPRSWLLSKTKAESGPAAQPHPSLQAHTTQGRGRDDEQRPLVAVRARHCNGLHRLALQQ